MLKSRTKCLVNSVLGERIVFKNLKEMMHAVGIILDDFIVPTFALKVVEDLDVRVGWIDFHDGSSVGLFLRKSSSNVH